MAASCKIQKLPEECVSQCISLTSPRDACRLEAVSAAFRSMAVSDVVWKTLLPSDCVEIVARAVDRVEFDSLKQLYFRLCVPIIIDSGKLGFFLDRETGIKSFILPARELKISWGDTSRHWRWINHPESRFVEVAELVHVCWLEIHGKINSRMLSKRSNYYAYLIFKVSNNATCFVHPLIDLSVTLGTHVSKSSVHLVEKPKFSMFHPIRRRRRRGHNFMRDLLSLVNSLDEPVEELLEPPNDQLMVVRGELSEEAEFLDKVKKRRDGWMEVLLGEFYNGEGDDGDVVMSLLETKVLNWKSGLIVEGIEIRPNKK